MPASRDSLLLLFLSSAICCYCCCYYYFVLVVVSSSAPLPISMHHVEQPTVSVNADPSSLNVNRYHIGIVCHPPSLQHSMDSCERIMLTTGTYSSSIVSCDYRVVLVLHTSRSSIDIRSIILIEPSFLQKCGGEIDDHLWRGWWLIAELYLLHR